MDPKARAEMADLHGRIIAIQISGTDQTIYLAPGPEIIQLFGTHEGEPDCLLQGSPMTLAQLRTQIPETGSAIPEDMQTSGDVELAKRFCQILRQVEIDWEAHLSKYTGSLIAGEISKAIDFAGYWGDHITATLKHEMQEMLQDDSSVLPSRHEIARFGAEVEGLSEQLKQLQKRVDALQNRNNPKGAKS
jgi:ubiquinone biosynthesis protein UbiJ